LLIDANMLVYAASPKESLFRSFGTLTASSIVHRLLTGMSLTGKSRTDLPVSSAKIKK